MGTSTAVKSTRFATALLLFLRFPALSSSPKAELGTVENPYPVPRATSPVKTDGALDEDAWTRATVIELNYEVSPKENAEPPVKTEILLTYDRSNFLIGFRCYDPDPSQIRAHFSDRDSFVGDDWVAVEIDTYNDSRRAFTLFSTPLGVQMDGLSDAAGVKDYNWDIIYDSAGKVLDWGYSVEMAIPFSSLRFQRTDGPQIWGINAVRGYPRNVAHQIWAQPYDRGNNCRVCQYLRIQGFEDASPGRNVEITPTFTAIRTDEREGFPEGDLSHGNEETEAGLTARWGITPNLALSTTYNPDFSQVEADSAQLDINQPFALFYAEKRPFFTEGLDYFRSPLDVIYTRTLRDPTWGMKLSGKEGAHAIGLYVVEDEVTNFIFPGSEYSRSASLHESNTSTVLRYSRDMWNNSNIGVLLTDRSGGDYSNTVYGLDGNLRFSDNDEVTFQLLGSRTQYDPAIAEDFDQPSEGFRDEAVSATYTHKTRYHQAEIGYLEMGDGFRADLGFIPQVGFRRVEASSQREWIADKTAWWTKFRLVNSVEYTADQNGNLLKRALQNSFSYSGNYQTSITIGNTLSRERYGGVDFELSTFSISASSVPTGSLSLSVTSSLGDALDYVNTRKGSRFVLAPGIICNIGAHLRLDLNHNFEQMNVAGERLHTANISETAVVYYFNARAFLRALLQYYDYSYNVSNSIVPVEPTFERLFSQLLFSYEINPRTVFFLGYTDNYFGAEEYRMTKKDQTFFAKVGYAWML